jgi:Pyridoxamine 5'-phosphate oxidase
LLGSSGGGVANVRFTDDVADAVERYLTCELTTVGKAGTPITWPTVARLSRASDTFTITTSIGLPVKAFNIRRNPRVAMLFSDATGSGSRALPQIHVQGTASCPDVVVVSPDERQEYWRRVYRLQPAGRLYGSNAILRWLFAWYYYRLIITVIPQRVWTDEPVILKDSMTKAPLPRGAAGPYSEVIQRLPRYHSAVMSWLDTTAAPTSVRAALSPTSRGLLRIEDAPPHLRPGPASILCHTHNAKLWNQRSFLATGQLNTNGSGWTFTPQHFVPGMSGNPVAMIKFLHAARSSAHNYLAHRAVPRPTIPWDAYHRLAT